MEEVPYIQKENKKVNNQYTFVSHDAVTAAISAAMIKHGLISIPNVKQFKQDGNRTVAEVDITFVNIDEPEEKITISGFGYGIDTQDKGPGKAISYAVKYIYLKAFCCETGDDPERHSIEYVPEQIDETKISEFNQKLSSCVTIEELKET